MKELIKLFLRDEEGATMVEYSIMVAFIATVCFSIIVTLGTQVQSLFQTLIDQF